MTERYLAFTNKSKISVTLLTSIYGKVKDGTIIFTQLEGGKSKNE